MPSHIIAMAIEAGQDGPLGERPAYQPEPGIPPHLLFYWDAFWDLASTDGIGFAELDRYASGTALRAWTSSTALRRSFAG
jgi:hypothetical protein